MRKMRRRIFLYLRVQLSLFLYNTRLQDFQGLILHLKSLLTKNAKTIPTVCRYIILKSQCYMEGKLSIFGHDIESFTSSK